VIEVSWVAVAGICAIIMAVIAVGGFWMRFSDRLTNTETSAAAATVLSTALQVKVDTVQKELQLKGDTFQREFSDYREAAAIRFVSDKELSQVEERFRGLAEEIKRDIRGVTDRLDRVLDAQGHQST
jgi:hypothetical protein